MLLHITDWSGEPLCRQISRQLLTRFQAGDLRQGVEPKPARLLAREQHVSVSTVERAYQELAQEGLSKRDILEAIALILKQNGRKS